MEYVDPYPGAQYGPGQPGGLQGTDAGTQAIARAGDPNPDAHPSPRPAKAITLKLAHQFAPTHDITKVYDEWVKAFNSQAGGKVVIESYPAEQLDAAKTGVADLSEVACSNHAGEEPLFDIANVPLLYRSHIRDRACLRGVWRESPG